MAGKYVEELVARLGWEVDKKALSDFSQQVDGAATSMRNIVGIAGSLATAAVAYFVSATNKATAMNTAIAQSAGVSAQAVEDWSRALTVIGMGSQQVAKTLRDLNKRIGGVKSGIIAADGYNKALKSIGLTLEDVIDLPIEEQFKTFLSAMQGVDDAQVAIAAGQLLLGKESSKLIGYLRTQSRTVEEILELQGRMNLQTDAGRDGAMRFFGAWDMIDAAVTSSRELIAGLVGEQLAPMMESLVSWIAANRELIQIQVAKWADRIGTALGYLVSVVKWFLTWVDRLVTSMGGLETVVKLVGIAVGSMITVKAVTAIIAFAGAIKSAGVAAMLMNAAVAAAPLLIAAVIALLFLLGEDLYHFFTGGESLLGEIGDAIAKFARANITPFIASLLGMTPDEFDYALSRVWMRVEKFFTQDIPGAYKSLVDAVSDGMFVFFNGIKSVYTEVKNFISGMFAEIKNLYDQLPAPIKFLLDTPAGKLRSIGELFSGFLPTPSAGAQATAATITNSTGGARTTNQNVGITVNQQPGENGPALARRIKDELNKAVGGAVKGIMSGQEV
jgi:hypothetical protein